MMVDAAVIVPVYRTPLGAMRLVLIRRSAGGVHGGQIALPGGKHDDSDRTMLETALRETEEELGIDRTSLDVLSALPVSETVTTGYRVTPFLARIIRPDHWQPSPVEVDEVLDVDVRTLIATDARGRGLESSPLWSAPREVEYLRLGGDRVWGLTYRILDPLLPRLLNDEWPV